eukprot:5842049-Prymnesium_polylepis.1
MCIRDSARTHRHVRCCAAKTVGEGRVELERQFVQHRPQSCRDHILQRRRCGKGDRGDDKRGHGPAVDRARVVPMELPKGSSEGNRARESG